MEKVIFYTIGYNEIIESMSEMLKCNKSVIENYIQKSNISRNDIADDIDIFKFFKSIGIKYSTKGELYELIKFNSIIISHLSSRLVEPNNKPVINLIDALTSQTDLSMFLKSKGIIFKKKGGKIETLYNDTIVNWESYDNSYATRILVRLNRNDKYIDNCINGFLFNSSFWEDGNVEHIKKSPEILIDICTVLQRYDILKEWKNKAKAYAIGIIADVQDLIIDNRLRYKTERSKIYYIYKQVLYFLALEYRGLWEPRHDNEIIRLKDNLNVSADNVLGYYGID